MPVFIHSTPTKPVPCVDPRLLHAECVDRGLPVDLWLGKANLFTVPAGKGPGTGAVLLRYDDLLSLDTEVDLTLTFLDDAGSVALTKVVVTRAVCVTPGASGDDSGVFLCELADRRWHLARIPVDKAYNLQAADGSGVLSATKNGGSSWTWATLVQDLWTVLGLGTAPSLPFTPAGSPENLTYWGGFAWAAVNDVLERIGCQCVYDPRDDTFTFVRIGTADPATDNTLTGRLDDVRTWDDYPAEPTRGWRPEKVRVLFPRRPAPTDGNTPWYAVDVTLSVTSTTGVVTGTYVALKDGTSALGATGTPSNSAALATVAAEVAADWERRRRPDRSRWHKVYRDTQEDGLGLLRTVAGRAAVEDRGLGHRTEAGAPFPAGDWEPFDAGLPVGFGSSSSGVPIGSAYIPFPCRVGSNDAGTPPKYTLASLQCSAAGVWSDVATAVTLGAFQQLAPGGATPGVVPSGTRAIGWKDAVTGTFLFVVADEASATGPGWVTTLTQTFDGDKTFQKNVVADTFRTTHGYTGGIGWDVDSLGDARFQQDIYVTKTVHGGQGNLGSSTAKSPFFGTDYFGRALEIGSAVGGIGRETKVYGARFELVGGGLIPTLWQDDPGTPLGFVNIGGTGRCFALQVWREYYTGSNLSAAVQNFSFAWSGGKFQGSTNTLTGFEYDTSTLIWKFNGVAFETDTKFRCNGNDGITVVTAGATFTGGILTAGAITATVNSGSATNLAGVIRGNGSTLSGAELSGDVTTSGSNATTIANNAVTTAKIDNGAVTEAKITLADNTTNNVTSSAHGFAPKSPADATQFLNGAATPAFAAVKDSDLSTSDITTNNATTAKHGFLKKLSNVATEYMDGTGAWSVPAGGAPIASMIPGGRLTLSSTIPVTESDITGATTLYYLPYLHTKVKVYTGSEWKAMDIGGSGISIAISGTSLNVYDVFVYDNAGTPTLELGGAWTNDSTRSTAIAQVDGVPVRSGATTRTYLGSIWINATNNQCDDSATRRGVFNMYNRVNRYMAIGDNTSHSYTTAAWRKWRNGTTTDLYCLLADPWASDVPHFAATGECTGGAGYVGVGWFRTATTTYPAFDSWQMGGGRTMGVRYNFPAFGAIRPFVAEYGVASATFAVAQLWGNVRQ
jgi:hypothetical protein